MKKDDYLYVKVSKTFKEILKENAKDVNKDVSKYIRDLVLKDTPKERAYKLIEESL